MSLLLKIRTPLRISFDFIPDQLYWLELLRIETKVFPKKKKKFVIIPGSKDTIYVDNFEMT